MIAPLPPQFLLIDPHPVLRRGLVSILTDAFPNARTTGAENFTDAHSHLVLRPVDLVIAEFRIDGETIVPLLEKSAASGSSARILIHTDLDELLVGVPSVRAGASGVLSKRSPIPHLLEAVRALLAGRSFLSESLAHALANGSNPPNGLAPVSSLSPRELEIFSLIGQCLTVSQIATRLGLAVKTVEAHREHIKNKLTLQSASQVTAAAVRWADHTSPSI